MVMHIFQRIKGAQNFHLLFLASLLLLLSCDPPRTKLSGSVTVLFCLSDTNSALHSGDTLEILARIPRIVTLSDASKARVLEIKNYEPVVHSSRSLNDTNICYSLWPVFITKGGFAHSATFRNLGLFDSVFILETKLLITDTGIYELEAWRDPSLKVRTDKGDLTLSVNPIFNVSYRRMDLLCSVCPKMLRGLPYPGYNPGFLYGFRAIP